MPATAGFASWTWCRCSNRSEGSLQHVVERQPAELALAVLDSATHQGRCWLPWLRGVLDGTAHGRMLARLVDPGAGAGGESIVRWRLRQAGIRVETQRRVPGLGPRDFRLGERLILEIDGREHHALVEGFQRDRWLDRELQLRGDDVLRFTDAEVLHDWDRVLADIRRMVRADRHRHRGAR
ncbi:MULTISPECIES: endonuclease domain-containing protein [unclassified Agrococcus]|uniref:endonuclease domain-containing protein n=1 Tax=unclassified Agrococcus TaxID=2615065 RepID=UPI003619D32A